MANLTAVLAQLEQERTRLTSQLGRLNSAISALTGVSYEGTRPKRRTISAAGRAKIAAAQRLRWAKAKGGKVVSVRRRTIHFRQSSIGATVAQACERHTRSETIRARSAKGHVTITL